MIPELFTDDWVNALGWTLVHSIWQSLVILLIVACFLRFIPAALSRIRYAVSCAGFFLLIATSVITFMYLVIQRPASDFVGAVAHPQYAFSHYAESGRFGLLKLLTNISSVIQLNMPLIMTAWVIGFLIFMTRLISGVFYTHKLTSSAVLLDNEWSEYARMISKKLGIQRLVTLAQSHSITSPMVIGYFKPVILVPVGMLTGLTTEQLETIFLHELAHIKRHDYLINLVQSVVETVFFFNPVVWTLSELIRREREFCCDDLVIKQHGHASAYARALVQLEEVRLSKHAFALSLAENKNQLLNRIRRIMEKSVKNYSGKSRIIVPAVLLAAGLFCVSWLSIYQEDGFQQGRSGAAQDTLKPKSKKGVASYSRKRIITTDKNGRPHEEVIENFEGDEALRPMMEQGMPDISNLMPPQFPHGLDPFLGDPPAPGDSVPGVFGFRNQKGWEDFSKAFEEGFGKSFEDFYSFRGTDPSGFMKEFEENFPWPEPFGDFDFPGDSLKGFNGFGEDEALDDLMRQLPSFRNFRMQDPGHPDLHKPRDNFQKYEHALREQLIKDGYLSQKEMITNMEWTDDTFKVNGKEIKDRDRKKYQGLHDEYMGHRGQLHKIE